MTLSKDKNVEIINEIVSGQNGKKVLLVTGPSGAGKSTICSKFVKKYSKEFRLIKCHTTRNRRPSDNDSDYEFWKENDFNLALQQGLFLNADEYPNSLGTYSKYAFKKDSLNIPEIPIYLITNVNDAKKFIKNNLKGYTSIIIFVTTPTKEQLEHQLITRIHSDNLGESFLQARLAIIEEEMKQLHDSNLLIINRPNELSKTIKQLHDIISPLDTKM